ncbi:MAG: hypothetical protein KKF80_02010, partial [Candidatus Omnitrophica bacterium]|nr:hypothetical protein [Candidatus Omnitrophota bacterium]
MKSPFRAFLALFCVSVAIHIPCACAETLHYQETTGTVNQDVTWEIQQSETLTRLIATKPTENSAIEQDHKLGIVSWSFTNTDEGTSLKARRLNNIIRIEGTFKKKFIKKENKIDEATWCQPVAFALIPFADSTQESLTFWSINQKNMKAFK